jgi:hypothetical protein
MSHRMQIHFLEILANVIMFFFGSFYKELFNVEHHKYGSIISDYPKKYLT